MATAVFHHGALGDSVLVWPVLRALAPVVWVAPWGKAKLAERWVAGVRAVDGDSAEMSRLFVPGGECEVGDGVRAMLGDASRIVSFVSGGSDAWARNVEAIAGRGRVKYLNSRPPEGSGEHVTHSYAQQLGVEVQLPSRRENPDGPVVIHPGSGGRVKCWPVERFDALVEHLLAIGRPVTVVLGEVERERMPRDWPAGCEVVEPADLIELSRVISRAAVFVGNDSGPTHLAAQLGVRTVALFGPTDPRVWGPLGPEVTLLWPGRPSAMEWLGVEPVIEAVARG